MFAGEALIFLASCHGKCHRKHHPIRRPSHLASRCTPWPHISQEAGKPGKPGARWSDLHITPLVVQWSGCEQSLDTASLPIFKMSTYVHDSRIRGILYKKSCGDQPLLTILFPNSKPLVFHCSFQCWHGIPRPCPATRGKSSYTTRPEPEKTHRETLVNIQKGW